MKRFPLWTTLIPLAVGIGVYWQLWDRQHDAFRADLERVFGADQGLVVTGFPYRLEAELGPLALKHERGDWTARLSASQAIVNRGPWRPDPTILRLQQPQLSLAAPSLAGAIFDVQGMASQTSLRWAGDRIARLSTDVDDARLSLGLLAAPAAAKRFELHFRETPTTRDPASRAPTDPEQAQIVLGGEAFRFAGGDPLTLAGEAALTSVGAIRSLAAWQTGGTLELKRLTLADKTGEVLALAATVVPGPAGSLRVAGTIDTVCPRTVEAAFAGQAAPAEERRARKSVRLTFDGAPGAYRLTTPVPERLPVRGQEPACPRLRGR